MSRLRRTGRANLQTPHLATYVQYVYKMRGPNLHPPGTSSLGTAYFSTLLVTDGVSFEVNASIDECLAWTKDFDAARPRLQTYTDILERVQGRSARC